MPDEILKQSNKRVGMTIQRVNAACISSAMRSDDDLQHNYVLFIRQFYLFNMT